MPHPRQLAAWAVHLFTASGAVASLFAIVAILDARWVSALSWMAVTMLIDSVDGMLARSVGAARVLPNFDGALLDNLVDYLGYVLVPALFLVRADLLPPGTEMATAAALLLSSAYQFCQRDAKTADHFFKGFPSFWNVAVFYLHYGGLSAGANLAILLTLVAAVFVPLRWAYPSRMESFRGPTIALTALWGGGVAAVLILDPEPGSGLVLATLAYVPCYVAISLGLSGGRTENVDAD